LAFLAGFALIWATLQLTGPARLSAARGVLAFVATLACAVAVLVLLLRVPPREAPKVLGLGRPTGRALLVAGLVSAACVAVYPLFTVVTGNPVTLRPGWPAMVLGLWAFNGMAEELAWRGYVFGLLRPGRSFRRAVLLSMPIIAVTHVPIVISSGPVVGVAAMIVAAVTTLPLAFLYERGAATIWAPAMLHAAIDSFRVVTVPEEATTTFSLFVIVLALVVPLLVFPVDWALSRSTGRSGAPITVGGG
jgi:membrane protease YdiL (CAAX protease family)